MPALDSFLKLKSPPGIRQSRLPSGDRGGDGRVLPKGQASEASGTAAPPVPGPWPHGRVAPTASSRPVPPTHLLPGAGAATKASRAISMGLRAWQPLRLKPIDQRINAFFHPMTLNSIPPVCQTFFKKKHKL